MARLSRIDDARDDHAAPAVRLLLADAHARPRALKRAMRIMSLALAFAVAAATAAAQQRPAPDPARADAAIKAAFPTAPADWQGRLTPDDTMKACSASHNSPAKADAAAIQE